MLGFESGTSVEFNLIGLSWLLAQIVILFHWVLVAYDYQCKGGAFCGYALVLA